MATFSRWMEVIFAAVVATAGLCDERSSGGGGGLDAPKQKPVRTARTHAVGHLTCHAQRHGIVLAVLEAHKGAAVRIEHRINEAAELIDRKPRIQRDWMSTLAMVQFDNVHRCGSPVR